MAARKQRQKDPMGAFSRVYHVVLDSPAWVALSWSAQGLYMAMRRKMGASNNGNVEATLATLRESGFASASTLAKGLRELLAVGLIAKTRNTSGVEHGSKVCCLYRFTDVDCYAMPRLGLDAVAATNEWRTIQTIDQARAALMAAEEGAQERGKARAERKKNDSKPELNRLENRIDDSNQRFDFRTGGNHHSSKSELSAAPIKTTRTPMNKGRKAIRDTHKEIVLTTSKFEHLSNLAMPVHETGKEHAHV
jgi:hypothetical protein